MLDSSAFFDKFAEVLRTRRTINDYLPHRPPDELVVRAIELARWAPNHKRTEPWRFHLLGPAAVAAVIDLDARLTAQRKGAEAADARRRKWSSVPGWLAVTCLTSSDDFRRREDYAACCCAIQNLLLALWAEGVGSKWSTGEVTRTEEFARLLGIDPAERCVAGLIWYGYPASIPAMRRAEVEEILDKLP